MEMFWHLIGVPQGRAAHAAGWLEQQQVVAALTSEIVTHHPCGLYEKVSLFLEFHVSPPGKSLHHHYLGFLQPRAQGALRRRSVIGGRCCRTAIDGCNERAQARLITLSF